MQQLQQHKFLSKLVLHPCYKPLFFPSLMRSKQRLVDYEVLKTVISKLFNRIFYPHNVEGCNIESISLIMATRKRGIQLNLEFTLKSDSNTLVDVNEIASDVRTNNVHPDFLKYIKIYDAVKTSQ